MPHICSFKYSYLLTVMFNSIHTLGTMCDSSLGYERVKHCPIFCNVISKNTIELKF